MLGGRPRAPGCALREVRGRGAAAIGAAAAAARAAEGRRRERRRELSFSKKASLAPDRGGAARRRNAA